jgi:hypothetical protein
VRRNAALLVMLAAEVGVAALAIFFQLRPRPAILGAFREYGTELPATAALALAPWFLPSALGFAAVASLVGLAAPLRRTRRAFLVGVGLMVAAGALIFAVCAAFLAVFQAA